MVSFDLNFDIKDDPNYQKVWLKIDPQSQEAVDMYQWLIDKADAHAVSLYLYVKEEPIPDRFCNSYPIPIKIFVNKKDLMHFKLRWGEYIDARTLG